MRQWHLRDARNVEEEIERSNLIERRRRLERKVERLCREVAYWNRCHTPTEQLSVDDERGTLAKACTELGLDLEAIKRRVEAALPQADGGV